jgi:carbonic anhydrase
MKAPDPLVPADEALQRLIDGNERFADGRPTGLGSYQYNVSNLAQGQKPFATVLGCSDSRVPPELIFDVGLGELFVIRVAGNVYSPEIGGSLQYAGAHLNTALFVVLGHKGCGAVNAAINSAAEGTVHHSRIQILVDSILPSIGEFDPQLSPAERLDNAVENNMRWTVRQIMEMPEAKARQAEGVFKIVGGIYDIETAKVSFKSV